MRLRYLAEPAFVTLSRFLDVHGCNLAQVRTMPYLISMQFFLFRLRRGVDLPHVRVGHFLHFVERPLFIVLGTFLSLSSFLVWSLASRRMLRMATR